MQEVDRRDDRRLDGVPNGMRSSSSQFQHLRFDDQMHERVVRSCLEKVFYMPEDGNRNGSPPSAENCRRLSWDVKERLLGSKMCFI